MSVESEILRARLVGESSITDLIGGAKPRCYPVKIPQGSLLPLLVYRRLDDEGEHTHDGVDTWRDAQFRIEIHAADRGGGYSMSRDLMRAVRNAWDGWSGTVGARQVHHARVIASFDDYDEQTEQYVGIVDIRLSYRDA